MAPIRFARPRPELPAPPSAVPPAWLIAIACVGAVLFLVAAAKRRGRACMRMRPRLSRPAAHGDAYLEAFVLKSVLDAAWIVGITFIRLDWSTLEALSSSGRYLPLLAIAYVFARVRSFVAPLAEWGWRRGRGVLRELSIGVLAGLLLWLVRQLPRAPFEPGASGLSLASMHTTMVLGTTVWTPIVEETLYRGALYRYLRDRFRWLPAVVLSSAVFAAMHSFWQMPYAYVLGLACALLREWRGSLIAPVAAHASWNLLSIAAVGHILG